MNLKPRHLFGLAALLAVASGCAHPAPRAIALPTTAAIRLPLAAAQASNARALDLARREQAMIVQARTAGLTPAQARELSPLIDAHAAADGQVQDHLTAALYQAGALDRAMAAKQAQIDALEKHDAAQTAKVSTLSKTLKHWRAGALMLVVADYFIGAPIQRAMQGTVAFCWGWAARGYGVVALALKTAFPLYFFWLPAPALLTRPHAA